MLCLGLCLLLAFGALAAPVGAAERQTVRAGLYASPGYAYRNEDGSYAGADVEYAYRIAQKAGFDLTITLYDNDPEMTEDLDAGKVDMLFDFGKTAARQLTYLFSENPIGSVAQTVYVRSGDDRFTYGDVSQLRDKVFGCQAGNALERTFFKWCQTQGFTPQIREYPNTTSLDAALDAGEIDAGLIGENGHAGYKTIHRFSPQPYYILFRGSDTALKSSVDSAMNLILANEPLYEEKLLEKYNVSTAGSIGFSAAEKQYLSAHPVVRVAVVKNDSPYFSQAGDGSVSGIIPDYYQRLADFTGLSFRYQAYDSNTAAIAAVRGGQADLLAMFSDGVITASGDGLLLTDAYENVDSVLLTRSGTSMDEIRLIAVKERSVNNVRQSIAATLNAQVVPVSNARAGFEALRKKQVDAVVCGLPTATWLLNQTNSSTYSTSILSSLQFDLCGAAAVGSETLVSVLDKAIAATNYGFEGIVEDNSTQDSTWQSAIARIPPAQIAVLSALLLFIILILILALVSIVRRQQEKAQIDAARAENEKKQLQLEAIERSAEERNRFFSDMSHDMRTPLTAILGFSDLIADESELSAVRVYNEKIRSSGKLLLGLINDTLTLSKIGNNKPILHPVPVDTGTLLDPVITPIQSAAAEKGVHFTVDRSRALRRTVLADPLNVQKILLNLLSNAVKYTPAGGYVELIIANEPAGADEPDSLLIVRDDGIGMSEEFQQRMFEPFSQERRAGYGGTGTGLGLSIVRGLVTLMGGSIEVQSKKNAGSVFTVRLHFKPADSAPQEAVGQLPADIAVLAGKKLLLCEDNEMNREIACALLSARDLQVTTAENGQEGLRLFADSAEGEYAAILMDLRMPVMDGYAATAAIRALDRPDADTVPIIAMTADAFADDVQRALDAGMNAHVAKPIDPDRLFGTLAALIE